MRLREAKLLLKGRLPCGAYYVAGFAVECALKACIARKTRASEFPDKKRATEAFEHSPEKLIKVAELRLQLDRGISANPIFANYWSRVKDWNVERRYETATTLQEAKDLIEAIDDQTNGVLQWLQNYW
jgi:HEPN domain-containing protein